MKKIYLFLTTAVIAFCFVGCENEISSSENEVERSGKYIYSYLDQEKETVEQALEKSGWELNYSGKNSSGSPIVLYVYNRPIDNNWKPIFYDQYASANQRKNYEAWEEVLNSGKIYGELYMLYSYGRVLDMGVYWSMATAQHNEIDIYKSFSNNLYKAYKSDCGTDASWKGKLESNEYTDHQKFIDDLPNYSQPKIKEDASSRISFKCAYSMETNYSYNPKAFEMIFQGEKYSY